MIGQLVTTKVDATNYYQPVAGSKYYYGPAIIPAGVVGIIGAEDVACVRLRHTCKCPTFVCVDFPDGGRAAYHKHEFKRGG